MKGQEWYPKALRYALPMRTRGKYPKRYPEGSVLHHTAGRDGAAKTIASGIRNGYAYLCCQKDGLIVQAHPISEWGYHGGESAWKIGVKRLLGSVSDDLIGLEVNSAGLLSKIDGKFYPWWAIDKAGKVISASQEIKPENVRYVTEAEWGCPSGYYEKFTPQQEASIIDFYLFLKENDPVGCFDFDLILGHHEVSGKLGIGRWRKNDPGGCLSMPMPKLRELLKFEYKKRQVKLALAA